MTRNITLTDTQGNFKENAPDDNQYSPVQQEDVRFDTPNHATHNKHQGQPYNVPPRNPPVDPMRAHTQANNKVSGYVESEKRRAKAEEELYDASRAKRLSDELWEREIDPLPDSIKPNTEMPVNSLPADLKELAQLTAMKLGVAIPVVIHTLLGAIFIAARGCFEVQVDKRYKELVTEYMLAVLPSGSRKSALVEMFRHVFEQEQNNRKYTHNHNKPRADIDSMIRKKIDAKIINEKMKLLISEDMTPAERAEAASLIAADLDDKTKEECLEPWHVHRLLVDAPTLKKLALIMAEQNETIGVFEAEPGLLKYRISAGQENILLKAYNAEPFSDEVTMTRTSVVMDSPVLAINIFAQDGVAEDLFKREKLHEDGLLHRFLTISCPAIRLSHNSFDETRFDELLDNYEEIILRLLQTEFQQEVYGYGKVKYCLRLSSDAEVLRWQFVNEINQQLEIGIFRDFEAFGRKLAGHAVRLAGAIHLWEHNDPTEMEISDKTMQAAIELARFYKVHAAHMFCSEISKGHKYAKVALKWIDRLQKYQFTENEIRRGTGEKIDNIRAGLAFLERHHYLRRHTRRKTTHCIIHPRYNFTHSINT